MLKVDGTVRRNHTTESPAGASVRECEKEVFVPTSSHFMTFVDTLTRPEMRSNCWVVKIPLSLR